MVFGTYLLLINLVGVICMRVDKRRAILHEWRISEAMFFLIAFAGGAAGCWAGMYIFRHKTKHSAFVVGMPVILAVQIALYSFGKN